MVTTSAREIGSLTSSTDAGSLDKASQSNNQEELKAGSLVMRTGSVGAKLSVERNAVNYEQAHSESISKPCTPCGSRSTILTPFGGCSNDELLCPSIRIDSGCCSEGDDLTPGSISETELDDHGLDEHDDDVSPFRTAFGTGSCVLFSSCSDIAVSSCGLEAATARRAHQRPESQANTCQWQAPRNAPRGPCQGATAGREVEGAVVLAGKGSKWADIPDDVLGSICRHMPAAYVRVVRLVCKGWAGAAGRLMQRLKPENLDGARLAACFPYLRSLDLSHCLHTVTFHSENALLLRSNVSDELIGLLAPLRHLRELSLRGCTMLTGRLDTGFGRLLALSSLRWLDISNCESLQDEAMQVVGQLTGLRQLRMVGCKALTDAGLAHMAPLQSLVRLELGCDVHFTDSGIAMLAALRGLQHVTMVSLAQVTNAGVLKLAVLPRLQRMTISRCPNICETGLQEAYSGKQLRVLMCGTPLRRSMCAWMSSVLADLDNLLFER